MLTYPEMEIILKPTYTGLIDLTTKYDYYIPTKFKGNFISILIYRVYNIKNYLIFAKEIYFISNIHKNNGYPLNFILRNIKKTLNNFIVPPITPLTVSKYNIYMKLPYLGSIGLIRKLTSLKW